MDPERTFPPNLETVRALRSLQHVAQDAGVFVVDVAGPQHRPVFTSRAWITTSAGVQYEAFAEAGRSKAANALAAAALLAKLHAAEPGHPTRHHPTYAQRVALRERIEREKASRERPGLK